MTDKLRLRDVGSSLTILSDTHRSGDKSCKIQSDVRQHAHIGVVDMNVTQVTIPHSMTPNKMNRGCPMHITGSTAHRRLYCRSGNSMADVTSRIFGQNLVPDTYFLSLFSSTPPLSQQKSWQNVRLMPYQILLVTLTLRGARLPL